MNALRRLRAAGFTLIELMISLAIAGVVLTAAYKLLVANQRFYRSQSVIGDLQSNIREATLILAGDLREISSEGKDLIQMTDTAVTINAMRSLGFVCSAPDLVLGRVVLKNSSLFSYRAIDPTRDSIFIFREGDPQKSGVDRWLRGKVSATNAQNCADGSAGTRIGMTGLVGGAFTQMDSVNIGAPVRTFETVNYRLYQDAAGRWWLGMRTWVSGAWNQTNAVAGPLLPNTGLQLTYMDSTGAVTATDTLVRSIGIMIRGQSLKTISIPGHPTGVYNDSLSVTVALRNN